MLVINSNSDTSAMILANREGDRPSYPDFNQILLKPNIPPVNNNAYTYIVDGETFPSRFEVKVVNGTRINFRSTDIIAPICFTGAYNGINNGYGSYSHIRTNADGTSGAYRVGLDYQFPAGKVLGKYVYGLVGLSSSGSTSNATYVKIKPGLLHTDGTITYIGTAETDHLVPTQNQIKYLTYKLETSGITTLEGDYLIAEIYVYFGQSGSIISFGRDGGSSTNVNSNSYMIDTQPLPIQISIE